MMSQNRQAARDRLQNDFVSKAILRNEHQTRHVDAKLDHLLTYQWKRLLEIQEIQTQLLEAALEKKKTIKSTATKPSAEKVWSNETTIDPLTRMVLRHYFESDLADDTFIFSHWHQDGDNFNGDIDEVEILMDGDDIERLCFKLVFPKLNATLDDLFSGEGSVQLRNDFNLPHMSPLGRFSSFKFSFGGQEVKVLNGELPPRYKPVFSRDRRDRITDLWKSHISWIEMTYLPPRQSATLIVPEDKTADLAVTLYPESSRQAVWQIYSCRNPLSKDELLQACITRPLSEDWECLVEYELQDEALISVQKAVADISTDFVSRQVKTFSVGTLNPGRYIFLCDDGRVSFHATLN